MPSLRHEVLLDLFRNRPQLAPSLLCDECCAALARHADIRVESADLSEIQPTEYRADLVLSLSGGASVLCVIVEVQLSIDEGKRFSWPAYVAILRSRRRCPVCLLIVCGDAGVAKWAERPIPMGCTNTFVPRVLALSDVPEVRDQTSASANPQLAVLSALAHGKDPDVVKAAQIAVAALGVSDKFDSERARLYVDVILDSLSEMARTELQNMLPFKYEYQSDFARRYFGAGRVAGRAAGRAELVTRQLAMRFGALSEIVRKQIASSSIEELDEIGDRLLTAATLEEALALKS
jgi:hypothetical protein